MLRQFAVWVHPRPLPKVTPRTVELWLDDCDLQPRSRHSYIVRLRGFYKWMKAQRLVKRNPTDAISRRPLPRQVPRPAPLSDVLMAIDLAAPRMRCFLTLAAFAGLRAREIAMLEREEVWEHHDPPLLVVTHGKGNKERVIPLNPIVERSLETFGMPSNGPIFGLSPRTVSQYVSDHLHGVGVDATCHQLRHLFATRCYQESGGDIRMVQDLLGHSSPETTAIYAGFSNGRAAKVVMGLNGDRKTAEPS